MMTSAADPLRPPAPPPQEAHRLAVYKALVAVQGQTPEQIHWLGGVVSPGGWELPVLGDSLWIGGSSGEVTTMRAEPVRPAWQILALHYLSVSDRPAREPPQVAFADLPAGRGYAEVCHKRTVGRLCATVGKTRESIRAAAVAIGGRKTAGEPLSFVFDVFPRLAIGLVWHAPDAEFPAEATWLLPPNIEMFLPTEDIAMLCECCVSRLEGKPFSTLAEGTPTSSATSTHNG
jgi:hypothetical protein